MKKRAIFSLMMSLAAAPAAGQPAEPRPVEVPSSAATPSGSKPVVSSPVAGAPESPRPAGRNHLPARPLDPGPAAVQRPDPDERPVRPPLAVITLPDDQLPLPVLPPLPPVEFPPDIPFEPLVPPSEQTMPALPAIDMSMVSEAAFMVDRLTLAYGQDRGRDREAERREREREREIDLYNQGYSAALDSRYDRAIGYFTRVIELKGSKLDAAMYWKAYSQNRLGQRAEALTTLAELAKMSPNGTYRKQAAVLEAEVRRDIGQPVRPQDSSDDEVKLMALQALQHTAPEEAVPMLEKVLEGTAGPKVKQRALFVLAQSQSPRAREVLRNYAKGSSTPELQSQAIQYLGIHGGPEHRQLLGEIYGTTSDLDVKRRILRAFMQAGDKDRVFKAAQGEQNAELRAAAVTELGHMGAHDELWQLYQKEPSIDVKRRILRSMQEGGSVERLIELAKSEQNPELRRDAVRALGVARSSRTGDVLVQIYNSDTNVDVRKSVINALFIQENAQALVALARKEQDSALKRELVGRLSHMRNKVATDYMLELLGK